MPDTPDSSPEGAQGPNPAQDVPEGSQGSQTHAAGQSDTFSAEYVQTLRAEAAANRVKAKRADDLMARLVHEIVKGSGLLHDAEDFRYDPETITDEQGLPDPEKVAAQVQALAHAKPHLAKIRPSGNIGQGSEQGSADVNLHALLR